MSPPLLVLARETAEVLEEAGGWALTGPEDGRWARLRRAADRDDFLAAHFLVRVAAARLLGLEPADISIVQRCATCGGPHGRPEVAGHPEVHASLAHSRGVVAAAAGLVPVGVDVEACPAAAGVTPGDLSAAFTSAEVAAIEAAGAREDADPGRAMLLAWVRKEACLKAGLTDLDGLAALDLSSLPLDPPRGDRTVRTVAVDERWAVSDWWDGHAGAVGAVVAPAGTVVVLAGA